MKNENYCLENGNHFDILKLLRNLSSVTCFPPGRHWRIQSSILRPAWSLVNPRGPSPTAPPSQNACRDLSLALPYQPGQCKSHEPSSAGWWFLPTCLLPSVCMLFVVSVWTFNIASKPCVLTCRLLSFSKRHNSFPCSESRYGRIHFIWDVQILMVDVLLLILFCKNFEIPVVKVFLSLL